MVDVPKRHQRLSVALPSSLTKDIPHLREKTSRVGLVARALSIFRIDEAIIYRDEASKESDIQGKLFEKLLVYQETPQYMRRAMFPQDPDLQFIGTLPPLRLPNHPDMMRPRVGLVRDALVLESGRTSRLNAGFEKPVEVSSILKPLQRVTVRITGTSPELTGETIEPSRLPIYWSFRVSRTDFSLGKLLTRGKQDLKLSTSRRGRSVREVTNELTSRWRSSQQPIVIFGSPSKGIPEILAAEGIDLDTVVDFNLNTIPLQGVETVRTEEAIFATLATLNLLEES